MAGPWDHRIARFAAAEGLSPAEVGILERFLDGVMRSDSIEVSMGSFDESMADRTTQAFTQAEETTVEGSLFSLPASPEQRYLDVGRLGIGGMGEVRRVKDGLLNRFVAMKVIRPEYAEKRAAVLRFLAEAQATAQLQYPGAAPVHDLGRLADGRWYFTMKELRGQTLEGVISEYRVGRWERGLRGLIEILVRVADTVAYAHDNQAVHRDLKPANILVGAYGEVIVLDWGLVKATGSPEGRVGIVTDLGGIHTRLGTVIGTPSYMPPEQAAGRHDVIGPGADVYALGAMLYEFLGGRRPYEGTSQEVLEQLRAGPPSPLPASAPPGLVAICNRAMERDPTHRFAEAGAFAKEVQDWLDGSARRERALSMIERADQLKPVVERALDEAERLNRAALELLEGVPSWAPAGSKAPGWALQDRAAATRIQAELAGVERLQLLRGALNELPGMPEAESRLAYVYHFCHLRAEREGNAREAAQYEALLRSHDTGEYAAYLAGHGAVSLRTRPPGATVTLHRYETVDRKRVPVRVGELGVTPFDRVPLATGSYLLAIEAPDRMRVDYPVHVGRSDHWHGREPAGRAPAAVYLPAPSELGENDRYVAGGWCAIGPMPTEQVWVDGFVIQALPVSVGAYLEFLNTVLADGDEARAMRCQPRDAATPVLSMENGRFVLPQRRSWAPEVGVTCISLLAAREYATWMSGRTGLPWRLPWEVEWEKAARGVDGRAYAMGDHIDPAWAEIRDSSPDEVPRPCGAFADDVSPYGVRDLTGGAGDWCNDRYERSRVHVAEGRPVYREAREADRAVMRGGFRTAPRDLCQAWFRHAVPASKTSIRVGFRLVRSIEPDAPDPDRSGVFRLNPA